MKYREEHFKNGHVRAILEINPLDYVGMKLDVADRKLLGECDKSNLVADKLLALEMLARKLGDKI